MSTNQIPALLAATRDRLLASPVVASLVADGSVGATDGVPWIFTDYTDDGLPLATGQGLASVTLYQRAKQWGTTDNTARFPTVGVDVIASGAADTHDAEWQAHAVAQSLIDWLDDPARERQTGPWTRGVWVVSLRWDGSLTNVDMEGRPGEFRAEFSLEFQLV